MNKRKCKTILRGSAHSGQVLGRYIINRRYAKIPYEERKMSLIDQYQNTPMEELQKEVEKRLQWGYAHGHITLGQLEERLAKLINCQSKETLLSLLEDIPSEKTEKYSQEYQYRPEENETLIAIFSSNDRKGRWIVPRQVNCFSLFGSCSLDLRNAEFPHDKLEIRGLSIFGSIDVKVPPEIEVSAGGIPIFGSISNQTKAERPRKLIRFKGIAIFGSFHARTRKSLK
jgi:hypothetical protein